MINCPRCGASNPSNNRFCGSCGQVLSASGVLNHSPTPDADLPEWLRGSADESSAPSSGPSAAPPAATPTELPSWLSEIGLEDDRQPTEPAQAPDWLAQLQQTPPSSSEAADDLPPWLRSNDAPPPPAAPAAASEPLPDWLRDLDQEPPSPPAAPASAATTDDLPPWLRSNDAPPPAAPAAASEPLPDWLQELEAPPSPMQSTPAPTDDLPAWLQEDQPILGDQPGAVGGGAGAAADVPDWLKDFDTPAPTGATPQAAGSSPAPMPADPPQELPAWLSDFDTPAAPAAAAPTPPVDDVPPWLRSEEPPTANAAQPGAGAGAGRSETTELPAWLMDDTSGAGAQELDVPLPDWSSEFGAELPPAEGQQLPDWLHEIEPGATQLSAPAALTGGAEAVPDWLHEIEPAAAQPTPPAQTGGAEALPSWLHDIDTPAASMPGTAQTSAEAPDLPSWLLEESPTSAPSESFPGQPPVQPAADELPDWLLDTEPKAQPALGETQALPPWLSDDPGAAGQPTQPLTNDPGATQALPSWLLDESSTGFGAAQPGIETSASAPSDELPSWLAGDAEPAGSASTSYGQQADELPSWLSGDEAASTPAGSSARQDELPSWLAGDAEPAGSASASYDQQQDELPPWLAGDAEPAAAVDAGRLAAQGPSTAQPEQPTSEDAAELPAWLSDAAAKESASAGAATDTDLPPWLSGIDAEAPAKPAESASTLPAWLEEPAQPAKPAKPAAGQSEFLGGLDLPAWLREEGDTREVAVPVQEVAPEWLQRIAPEGDDPVPTQAAVAMPPAPRVVRTPERVESMRLLEQLIDAPAPEPLPQPTKRRRSWLLPVLLGLLLLLLAGAILVVLLNPRFNLGATPAPLPAAESAAQVIASLPANRPVVLAYEWDAQRLGDLRPLEETVIAHLAARKDVPLIFLSTDPQGALLAAERTDQIKQIGDNFHNQYGLGYVNLGFKAGGPIALRQFARNDAFGALFAQDAGGNDLRGNDVVMQGMCGSSSAEGCAWQNVGLLIVLADEVEDVRGWFEQVRSEHPELQTLLLTTTEIAPQVAPYAAATKVNLLAGAAAADAYSRARGMPDERVGRQVDAAAMGGAIFALLVVVGGPVAAFQGYRLRREAEVEEWER